MTSLTTDDREGLTSLDSRTKASLWSSSLRHGPYRHYCIQFHY